MKEGARGNTGSLFLLPRLYFKERKDYVEISVLDNSGVIWNRGDTAH